MGTFSNLLIVQSHTQHFRKKTRFDETAMFAQGIIISICSLYDETAMPSYHNSFN